MKKKLLAIAALSAAHSGLRVAEFAAAASGPSVAVYDDEGFADLPPSAEASPYMQENGEATLRIPREDVETAAVAESSDRTPKEDPEERLWHVESAQPTVSSAAATVAASTGAAAGSGAGEAQEAVVDDMDSPTSSLTRSDSSDIRQRGVQGNSAPLTNGGSGTEGGEEGQRLLLLDKDPLSPLLLLSRAPRGVGLKSFVLGLGCLLLAGLFALEGDDSIPRGPAHALAEFWDLDREDVSAIAFTLLVLLSTVSLISAVYRHFSRVRRQREWIQKAEEGIEAAKRIHQTRVKQILARQEPADMAILQTGKPY
ncbi:uncharacterized protein EMH_0006060 [Eimeria mitis]|uniref:Uncharacterized protein n=1 Tax=Eimeria mitis TaxID=44415 RepID=U6K3E2_9EIME|nr:uncharacterized protein EMH_0006060 [Eimeria mitis]CDJ30288.1 hypothetical protein, conserved [Eimeria mitis]